jgi:hypothetical protein
LNTTSKNVCGDPACVAVTKKSVTTDEVALTDGSNGSSWPISEPKDRGPSQSPRVK